MGKKIGFLFFGIIFGFTLSRVGASDYDLITRMFGGKDFKIALVILTAIIVGAIGMHFIKKLKNPMKNGEKLKISCKELKRFSLLGAAIFGIGWGMSGACPGTVLAQIGEGKLYGLITFLGMLSGTYIYALLKEKHSEL